MGPFVLLGGCISDMTIQIEDPDTAIGNPDVRGRSLACGLIGPWQELYEVFLHAGVVEYYVNGQRVDAQVYRDCMNTAHLDRFQPESEDDEDLAPGTEVGLS